MDIFLKIAMGILATISFLLATFNLPGNTLLLFLFVGYGFFTNYSTISFDKLAVVAALYLFGELWEFVVGYLGIKKENLTWKSTLFVGFGALIGAFIGSAFLPIVGSVIGSAIGAFLTAFVVGYCSGSSQRGFKLALIAMRNQFLAIIGKIIVGMVLFIMFIRILLA